MRSKTKLFAVAATMMVVLTAFAPAATAAVTAAGNSDDGDAGNAEDGNAGNAPANQTNGPFGIAVSSFVHDLMSSENDSENKTFGQRVAEFVLNNNPAADKIPDHAGPPEDKTQGQPDHAKNNNGGGGPPEDKTQGQPNHAKNKSGGGGPPDHAGGPP